MLEPINEEEGRETDPIIGGEALIVGMGFTLHNEKEFQRKTTAILPLIVSEGETFIMEVGGPLMRRASFRKSRRRGNPMTHLHGGDGSTRVDNTGQVDPIPIYVAQAELP
ncbi:hypothetical protein Syun_031365 [Stephania yunnanensis]|uniref:Uncharacterized protein n=1 Tax=Stephania yunnanensis TaxID=152371 RepID=A0AAP0HF97_9MAGN